MASRALGQSVQQVLVPLWKRSAASNGDMMLQETEQPFPYEYDVICGCLPPLLSGAIVCLLTFLEGLFVAYHVTGVIDSRIGWFPVESDKAALTSEGRFDLER